MKAHQTKLREGERESVCWQERGISCFLDQANDKLEILELNYLMAGLTNDA